MRDMDWASLVESQPALAAIPNALRDAVKRCDAAAGNTLFQLGDRVRGVFCVVTGEVRLIRRTPSGMEIVLQRTRRGFFAEASINASAYHCDAVAAASGMLLRFPADTFRAALAADSAFRNAWMAHIARELLRSRAQCERMGLKTAAQRILHYIESEGAGGVVTLSESRKAWAAELGLTHEALYRTLRRLQSGGTLALDGHRITLNPRRIVAAADFGSGDHAKGT